MSTDTAHASPNVGVRVVIALMGALTCFAAIAFHRRLSGLHAPSARTLTGTRWCNIGRTRKWPRPALLVFRLSVFLWQSAVLGTLIAYKYPSFREFAFYTVWNYILQTGWWLSAVAVSGCSIASVQPPRWMCEISYVLFSVSMPASMLVSIVMWTILAPHDIAHGRAPADINFFSFNMHAANTVLLLAEFAVNRVLIGSDALVYLVCWMCCYCAFTWIFEAFEHWWPYFFCDLSTWAALGWYTALLLLHLVAFAVAILFSRTKARLTKGLGPPALRLAETPTATAADALLCAAQTTNNTTT